MQEGTKRKGMTLRSHGSTKLDKASTFREDIVETNRFDRAESVISIPSG